MPVLNRIAGYADQLTEWRRHLHRHPELQFDLHATAFWVADRLREIGVDALHEGIARTGIVALIDGRAPGPTVALRADMDALPIEEATGADYASTVPGKMHACGHDGHTAMLLGAAKYLAETRNFAGRVALIFQPAEEGGRGAKVMVDEGIMERFAISEVYGLHNMPGMAAGHVATAPGPLLAAVDSFDVHITGKGGHGAAPHDAADPVVAAAAIITAFQTIVSRNHRATDDLVVSVTQVHAGSAHNVIPDHAWINGTVRSFDPRVQAMVQARMAEIVAGIGPAYGVAARLDYHIGDPATVNDPARAAFAADVAAEVVGAAAVSRAERQMWAEDFSYMLQSRPGAYLFLGNGASAGLHHPAYDFNDEIAPVGASLLARLAERALPIAG